MATFETAPRSAEDVAGWLAGGLPVLVAERDGAVVGLRARLALLRPLRVRRGGRARRVRRPRGARAPASGASCSGRCAPRPSARALQADRADPRRERAVAARAPRGRLPRGRRPASATGASTASGATSCSSSACSGRPRDDGLAGAGRAERRRGGGLRPPAPRAPRGAVDWDEVLALAVRHHVVGQLDASRLGRGPRGAASTSASASPAGSRAQTFFTLLAAATQRTVLGALRAAGVAPLVLKGAVLDRGGVRAAGGAGVDGHRPPRPGRRRRPGGRGAARPRASSGSDGGGRRTPTGRSRARPTSTGWPTCRCCAT